MLKYDTNIEDLDDFEKLFINNLEDESLDFMKICEQMCIDLINDYKEHEFDIETSSAFNRKIVHLIAKKYGLNSVRSGKYVTSQNKCDSCDDGIYKTTHWKIVKVSKYPLEKTKGNIKKNNGNKRLELANAKRKENGLTPITQTPRTSFEHLKSSGWTNSWSRKFTKAVKKRFKR